MEAEGAEPGNGKMAYTSVKAFPIPALMNLLLQKGEFCKMANRYENDPERNYRWDRDREHEGDRSRWDRGRESDRWREYGQGSYGSEGGGGYGQGFSGYGRGDAGDYRGEYRGEHSNRDWNRDWNRENDRGEWGAGGRNDWARREYGRGEQESGRYEGQRSPGYERYGTSSGQWSGGMGSQRG